jgi:ABC-type dipeptide/oligopeptide/nickel transport system ATPase subunit
VDHGLNTIHADPEQTTQPCPGAAAGKATSAILLTDRVASAAPDLTDHRVRELLSRIGLLATAGERHTDELSGGETQRGVPGPCARPGS